MRVSAIVMCHGQSAYLPEALDSLLAQTHEDLEVVVAAGDVESCVAAEQWRREHSGEGSHRFEGARSGSCPRVQ